MQPTHNKARLEQFSDGVFAIAITLLALELRVPHLAHTDIASSALELAPLIPNILTFILSFMTIAIFWVNHHQLTQVTGRISRRILWSNILILLFVTLIPFATETMSQNPYHPLAVMTYSFVLFGGSLSFSLLRYFVHHGLGEKKVSMGRSAIGPLLYIIAIFGAIASVWISYAALAIPPLFYFLPKNRPVPTE